MLNMTSFLPKRKSGFGSRWRCSALRSFSTVLCGTFRRFFPTSFRALYGPGIVRLCLNWCLASVKGVLITGGCFSLFQVCIPAEVPAGRPSVRFCEYGENWVCGKRREVAAKG